MKKIFISGSISISTLPEEVVKILDRIIKEKFSVLVGDAKGVDLAIQKYFKQKNYKNVSVVTVCNKPRNLVDKEFKIIIIKVSKNMGTKRKLYMQKDIWMAKNADYLLVIWDGKSKGSFSNIINGIRFKKHIMVYLMPEKRFITREELNEKNIKEIYMKYVGYNMRELYSILKEDNIFKNIKELKDYLQNEGIIKISENKIIPGDNMYKKYFIFENYKGHKIYKFSPNVVKIIKKKAKSPTLFKI